MTVRGGLVEGQLVEWGNPNSNLVCPGCHISTFYLGCGGENRMGLAISHPPSFSAWLLMPPKSMSPPFPCGGGFGPTHYPLFPSSAHRGITQEESSGDTGNVCSYLSRERLSRGGTLCYLVAWRMRDKQPLSLSLLRAQHQRTRELHLTWQGWKGQSDVSLPGVY